MIDRWNLPDIYKDPEWLPLSEREWKRIVNHRWNELYRSDLIDFLATNGRILSLVFGVQDLERKHMRSSYRGFIEELKFLYSDDITTSHISKSIKVLMNSTRLNYLERVPVPGFDIEIGDGMRGRRCHLCHRHRGKYANWHLIWSCKEVQRDSAMQWIDCKDFSKNRCFLEELQLRIDAL